MAAVTPRALGRNIPVYRPESGDAGASRPTRPGPTDTLSLREALTLALANNPALAAFAWEVRARESLRLQAGRLSNPSLGVMAEDLGARASGGSLPPAQPQTTLQLSQLVELPGKRAARRTLAARDVELASWDYETARIGVLTEVTHAFIDVLVAQEMVAITSQSAQLVDQVRRSVGERVTAGVVSPIEETRATVAMAAAAVEASRARRILDAARIRLAAGWGAADPGFAVAAGDLGVVPALPSLAAIRTLLDNNPDVARWAAEIARREAALAVERSRRLPDLALTGGYRRFSDPGMGAYLLGVSVTLPVLDRNEGATAAASSRRAGALEERRAAEMNASVRLADAYRALASAHEELTVFRERVLPGSQETFDLISEGYRMGKFGYLDVLDAQRTLIAASGQFLRALSEYHKAVADIERLIGAPLPGVSTR